MIFRGVFLSILAFSSIAWGSVCQNYNELKSTTHMDLGVNLQTKNYRIAIAMQKALNHWAKILDMSWHQDQTSTCAIVVFEGQIDPVDGVIDDAIADIPSDGDSFEGKIEFNKNSDLNDRYLELTAVHELGHLFGLHHNPNLESVMVGEEFTSDQKLDVIDIYALKKLHRLRTPMPIDIRIHY